MTNVGKSDSSNINTKLLIEISQRLTNLKESENPALFELAKELNQDGNDIIDYTEASLQKLLALKDTALNSIANYIQNEQLQKQDNNAGNTQYYIIKDGVKEEISKEQFELFEKFLEQYAKTNQNSSQKFSDSANLGFPLKKLPNITLQKITTNEPTKKMGSQEPLQYKTLEDLKKVPILSNYFIPYMAAVELTTSEDLQNGAMKELITDDMVKHTFNAIIEDKLSKGVKILEQKDGEYVKFDDGSEIGLKSSTIHSRNKYDATHSTIKEIEDLLESGIKITKVNTKKHIIVFNNRKKIKLDDSMDIYDIEHRAICQLKKDKGINIVDSNIEEIYNGIKNIIKFEDGTKYIGYAYRYEDDIPAGLHLNYQRTAEDGSNVYANINSEPAKRDLSNRLTNMSVSYLEKKAADFFNEELPSHYEYAKNIWGQFGAYHNVNEIPPEGRIVPNVDSESVHIAEFQNSDESIAGINVNSSVTEGRHFKDKNIHYTSIKTKNAGN